MTGSVLFEVIAFLAGAVICVSIAKKLGLSAVLGYLFAGIIIGPFLLGLVGEEGQDILHFAEFGVVMMLFLIGLEIEPKDFWKMRKTILTMGGFQVAATMALSYLLFSSLGYQPKVAFTFSMAVALSSTAIVLQTLKEKGQLKSNYGHASFSILLFQDIIVIFMLGILPLLSNSQQTGNNDDHGGASFIETLPIWAQTIAIIASVIAVIVAGRYLFVPMLRVVARTGVRELLLASALLIVFGIAFLMELVGLSPALGAFLGGVVLATSEFKHELESNLEPFKNLLLGLFFMAVGTSINFLVIANNPALIGGLVIGIVILKGIVLFLIATLFRMHIDQRLLLTIALAQIGEFAFVILTFAFQLNILEKEQMDVLLVVTAISMALTPILALINERVVLPNVGTKEMEESDMDGVEKSKVILVGFGHFGSTVGRFLRTYGVEATILDYSSNRVDLLRKMGFKVFYGDATRIELLEAAGIEDADVLIVAIDNSDKAFALVKMVKKQFPHVKLMVRAKNRYDAYDLVNMGVTHVYRETLDTSVKLASDVLSDMGFRKYTLHRQAQKFIQSDEESLRRLAEQFHHEENYIAKSKEEIAAQEQLMVEDRERGRIDIDHLWDSEQMRLQKEERDGE